MKKSFLFQLGALTMLAPVAATAAINDTGVKFEERPTIMYSRFATNNTTQLLFEDYDGISKVSSFTIYDENFKEITKFSTPAYPAVTAISKVSRAIQGPIGVYAAYQSDEEVQWMGETQEQFAESCSGMGYSRIVEENNEVRYYPNSEWEYFYFESFGYQYPTRYYVWMNGTGYQRVLEYSYDNWGSVGYGEPEEQSNSLAPRVLELYPKSEDCGDMDEITISQNLFNSDAEYEWIIPIIEAIDINYENDYEKVEGQQLRSTGFKVMSQNGSTISTVSFPSGYTASAEYLDLYLYLLGNKTYLMAGVSSEDASLYDDYYYIVYEVDSNTGSVQQVSEPKRVSVSPTAPRRGTPVNVSLGAINSNSVVSVISTNGRTVFSKSVNAGTSSIDIDTNNFTQGVYVVTVKDGNNTREATKIIVR